MRYLDAGTVVPMLGAAVGASDGDEPWDKDSGHMPTADDLARALAKEFAIACEPPDLARVAQHIAHTEGAPELHRMLQLLLSGKKRDPAAAHRFLAQLPGILRQRGTEQFQLIVSSGYDTLLERAFDEVHEPFDLAVFIARGEDEGSFLHVPWCDARGGEPKLMTPPNDYVGLPIDEDGVLARTVIVKIHGGVLHDAPAAYSLQHNFVITEDDYAGNLRETEELELPDSVRTASLSRDGRWLLATTYSGPAHLWRMRDGKHSGEPFELAKMSAAYPADAAFSPDGRSIVTTSGDGNVRIFDTHTRRPKRRYPHRGVFGAAFSPDGKTVVSFGLDATAQLWTAATGRTRHVLRGHSGLIGSAAFSPDGDRVLTGGADQMTRVWEVRSGKLLSAQRMHGDYINSVAFAPDGASILSASDDRTARIYPCATCAPTERLWKDAKRRTFFGAKDVEEIVEGR